MTLDHPQKLAALKRWADAIDASDQHFDALVDLMGLSPEGPMLTAAYAVHDALMHDALTQATADLVDDGDKWLNWYWLENDMGRKGLAAKNEHGLREIRTLEDLLWMLEDS